MLLPAMVTKGKQMKKNAASKNDGGGKKRGGAAAVGCRVDLISWDDCSVWQSDEKKTRKKRKSHLAVISW